MADMIPCKKCGHYDIVCDDEKNSYIDIIGAQNEVNRALQASQQRMYALLKRVADGHEITMAEAATAISGIQ